MLYWAFLDAIFSAMSTLARQFPHYLALIRFDKPIGTLLLLWPTLWALWLASGGTPRVELVIIFTAGTFLMRSAGCIINDYADRNLDRHVQRTAERPLTTGRVSSVEAFTLFFVLCAAAFALVLLTNTKTVLLSLVGAALTLVYPFVKRVSHLPQLVLGAAFAWGVPMAFTAQSNALPASAWLVYAVAVIWAVIYDTFYAMVDRDDDLVVGIKSAAILFGRHDRLVIALLQLTMLGLLAWLGAIYSLGAAYYTALVGAAVLFGYQQWLARHRERNNCFRAFRNNNWVGLVMFVGIVVDYSLR